MLGFCAKGSRQCGMAGGHIPCQEAVARLRGVGGGLRRDGPLLIELHNPIAADDDAILTRIRGAGRQGFAHPRVRVIPGNLASMVLASLSP